ncbi:MAG: hypothetical protein AAFV53_38360 [Myxococcota bacterium]
MKKIKVRLTVPMFVHVYWTEELEVGDDVDPSKLTADDLQEMGVDAFEPPILSIASGVCGDSCDRDGSVVWNGACDWDGSVYGDGFTVIRAEVIDE